MFNYQIYKTSRVYIKQRMSNRKQTSFILKPSKIGSNRQLKSNCQICDSRFQILLNTQHQCKRCYRVICQKCAMNKIKIYHPQGHGSIHKCCTSCIKQQEQIINFIKVNRLVFGHNSLYAEQWSKKLKRQHISSKEKVGQESGGTFSLITEFNEKIYETNNNIIRFKSESQRLLSELVASQNYSMRQFTGRIIQQISTNLFCDKISQTMIAIYAYLKDIPYSYELLYVVFFMLCFCNESECYFIITRYIEKVFPQYCKINQVKKDNLQKHELKMIIDMYRVLQKTNQRDELQRVVKLLQKGFFNCCIKSLLVNIPNITISIFVIDEMLKNGTYISLYKAIASLIFLSRQQLFQQEQLNQTRIKNHILKNLTIEQIKLAIIAFQKSNMKFEMDHQFFDSSQHRKLYERYKQLQINYQKSEEKYRTLDGKHSLMIKQYEQMSLNLSQIRKQNMLLSQEIIQNAEKTIIFQDLQKFRSQNQLLKKKINLLYEQNQKIKKQLQNIKKKETIQMTERIIFDRVKKDYERQIVDLRTKNQILEIQKQANNITFNTSFIDQKIQEKNQMIATLETENNKMKIELDFYRNSRANSAGTKEQSFFNANISNIPQKNSFSLNSNTQNNSLNFTGLHISTNKDINNFKRYLQMGKKIAEKLKSDLLISEKKRQQLEKQVIKLNQTVDLLQKNLEINQQISNFITQIPQEINFTQSIEQFEIIIGKQTNIHKKGKLETVLTNFRKCMYQVRYRSIDAKLKQNKIKQLEQINSNQRQINSKNESRSSVQQKLKDDQSIENTIKEIQSIQQALLWVGNQQQLEDVKLKLNRKEECSIM